MITRREFLKTSAKTGLIGLAGLTLSGSKLWDSIIRMFGPGIGAEDLDKLAEEMEKKHEQIRESAEEYTETEKNIEKEVKQSSKGFGLEEYLLQGEELKYTRLTKEDEGGYVMRDRGRNPYIFTPREIVSFSWAEDLIGMAMADYIIPCNYPEIEIKFNLTVQQFEDEISVWRYIQRNESEIAEECFVTNNVLSRFEMLSGGKVFLYDAHPLNLDPIKQGDTYLKCLLHYQKRLKAEPVDLIWFEDLKEAEIWSDNFIQEIKKGNY